MLKKTFILFLCLVILPGCGKRFFDSGGTAYGDAIIDASIGDASRLNPLLATDSASGDITELVFNGLVKYDKDIKLVGDLAESWDVSQDGLVITFHLRKGVKWHDGTEFTSGDVRFTYEKLIDPGIETPYSSRYEQVKSLELPDSYTVRVSYSEPFAPALESWGMGIIPRHLLADGDFNHSDFNRHPIGTGPYVFKEWVTDEKIVLEANPDYFEGMPRIARYIYRIVPDQSVQLSELKKGSIDYMSLNSSQYSMEKDVLSKKNGVNVYRYPSINSYNYMGYNLMHPVFKEKMCARPLLTPLINRA